MGYGESKLVSEHILHSIAKSIPNDTNFNILRIGQIAGPIHEQGGWNEYEWFPALLKSSRMLGKLPGELGTMDGVDWVPVDVAARVVRDVVCDSFEDNVSEEDKDEREGGARVFNLVNPSPVQFGSLVPIIKKRLGAGVEIVSFDAWVQALEQLDREDEEALERYPALKILEFFQGLRRGGDQGGLEFVTERSVGASQAMRDMEPINVEMIERWMRGWGM